MLKLTNITQDLSYCLQCAGIFWPYLNEIEDFIKAYDIKPEQVQNWAENKAVILKQVNEYLAKLGYFDDDDD